MKQRDTTAGSACLGGAPPLHRGGGLLPRQLAGSKVGAGSSFGRVSAIVLPCTSSGREFRGKMDVGDAWPVGGVGRQGWAVTSPAQLPVALLVMRRGVLTWSSLPATLRGGMKHMFDTTRPRPSWPGQEHAVAQSEWAFGWLACLG